MLREIRVQVGRTGALTPFAEFDPVLVAGSTIAQGDAAQRGRGPPQGRARGRHDRRAQGRRRHPRGRRAGAGPAARRAREPWEMPDDCPSCGGPVWRDPRARSCPAARTSACPAQRLGAAAALGRRAGAMDIDGMGDEIVSAPHRRGPRCTTSPTSTASPPEQLAGARHRARRRRTARRWCSGETIAGKLVAQIEASQGAGRSRGCCSGSASGTSGSTVAEVLARRVRARSTRSRRGAGRGDRARVEGVGPVIAAVGARVLRQPRQPRGRSSGCARRASSLAEERARAASGRRRSRGSRSCSPARSSGTRATRRARR